MNLVDALDRALGLVVLFPINEAKEEFLPASIWKDLADNDPDILAKLASTEKRETFYKALQQVVGTFTKEGTNLIYKPGTHDDQRIAQLVTRAIEGTSSEDDHRELSAIRKEARRWAYDLGVTKRDKLVRQKLLRIPVVDKLARTPSELETEKEKITADKEAQPARTYEADTAWKVIDLEGNQRRDGFESENAAKDWAIINLGPNQYKIESYKNPWSLSVLNTVVKPLDKGWDVDKIVHAMKPMVRWFANKYWSAKVGVEDLVQYGYIGVLKAIQRDKGIAPFGKFAPRHIKNEILRAALTKGLIRGPEKVSQGASIGEKGPIVSYEVVWYDKGEIQHKSFPATPGAFKDYYSPEGISPPLKMDPSYVQAQKFRDEIWAQGLKVVAETPKKKSDEGILVTRSRMGSLDKPIIGAGGKETSGKEYIRGRVASPAHLAATKDFVRYLLQTAKLSDQQRKAIELTFALDVPEGSISYFPKHGEKEKEERPTAEPIQVKGQPERSVARTSADIKGGIERGPVEVAQMMGVSTERARKLLQAGLDKIVLAAQKEQMEAASEAAEPTATKEDIDRVIGLMMVEEYCVSMILEMVFTGQYIAE